ncbi:MAG: hypothetical protein ACOY46_02305 [Bacillota bacterium]
MSNSLERELLALTMEEAISIVERAGLRVEVQYTGTARLPGVKGTERVVRFHLRQDTGIITVTCELTRQSGDRYFRSGD